MSNKRISISILTQAALRVSEAVRVQEQSVTKREDDEKEEEMEGVDDGRGWSVFLWSAIVTEKRLFKFESASRMCCYHLKVLCKSVEPSLICLIPTSLKVHLCYEHLY